MDPQAIPSAHMKTLTSLLILTTLLHLSTSSPVLDFDGNPVRTDTAYTIRRRGIGFFGRLTLRPLNGSSCARYAAFSDIEVDHGIPVVFQPYQPGATLETGHGHRFKIRFLSGPCCAGDGEWTVDEHREYVTAGGDWRRPSYFAVLPEEEGGRYTLGYCGSCALCENTCAPVGTDNELFLKVRGSSLELKVRFIEEEDENGGARSSQ